MLYPDVSHLSLVAYTWRMFLMPPGQNDRSGFFPSAVPRFSETEGKDMYQASCGSLLANNGERVKSVWQTYGSYIISHTIFVFQSWCLTLSWAGTAQCTTPFDGLVLLLPLCRCSTLSPLELLVRERRKL
jgi:hypothetical protein